MKINKLTQGFQANKLKMKEEDNCIEHKSKDWKRNVTRHR